MYSTHGQAEHPVRFTKQQQRWAVNQEGHTLQGPSQNAFHDHSVCPLALFLFCFNFTNDSCVCVCMCMCVFVCVYGYCMYVHGCACVCGSLRSMPFFIWCLLETKNNLSVTYKGRKNKVKISWQATLFVKKGVPEPGPG